MGQNVRPLDKTSVSVIFNTLFERFTTILLPEHVLYSLYILLLKRRSITGSVALYTGIVSVIKTSLLGELISAVNGIVQGNTGVVSFLLDTQKILNSFSGVFAASSILASGRIMLFPAAEASVELVAGLACVEGARPGGSPVGVVPGGSSVSRSVMSGGSLFLAGARCVDVFVGVPVWVRPAAEKPSRSV